LGNVKSSKKGPRIARIYTKIDNGHKKAQNTQNNPQISQIDADLKAKKSPGITPVPSTGATPEESTAYSTGQAGQARIYTKIDNGHKKAQNTQDGCT